MTKKSIVDKTIKEEQKTSRIAEKYPMILELLSILMTAIGILSNSLQLGFDIVAILAIIMVLLLSSVVIGAEARRVNWPSRISRLMLQKDIAETVARQFSVNFTHNRFYMNRLRELYLTAVSEGKMDLAKELWLKGQLSLAGASKSEQKRGVGGF